MTCRCNHHSDCDRVDQKHPGLGHCHDPDCESPTAENCPFVNAGHVFTLSERLQQGSPLDVDRRGQRGSSTPPIPCWSCGRNFSIGYVEGGEPVAYHALPMCAAFDAANTVAEMARFSEKCRLAQEGRLS